MRSAKLASRLACQIALLVTLCGFSCSRKKPAADDANKPTVSLEKGADGLFRVRGSSAPYTGPVYVYFDDGGIHMEDHYTSGAPDGPSRLYYKYTGQVKREKMWRNGEQTGEREWWPGGRLKSDSQMVNGIVRGWVRMWWENGLLRRSVYMVPTLQPHGQRLEYASDGTVVWDALFDRGVYLSGYGPPEDIKMLRSAQAHLAHLTDVEPE